MYKKHLIYCAFILFGTVLGTERNKLFKAYYFNLPSYPHTLTTIKSDYTLSTRKVQRSLEELFLTYETPCQSLSLTKFSLVNSFQNNPASYLLSTCSPDFAMVNKIPDQPSPLYNKAFLFCVNNDKNPVMVTEEEPAVICLVDFLATDSYEQLLVTPQLNDAKGNPAETIIALTTGLTGTQEYDLSPYIFAALKSKESTMYALPDIAVIKYDTTITKTSMRQSDGRETFSETRDRFLNVLDASRGINHGNKALAIPTELLTNGDFNHIKSRITDMCWNPYVERLYIAFEVVADSTLQSEHNVRALLVGRLNKNLELRFDSIAHETLFLNHESIMSGCGPETSVVLHKLRSMQTSSALSYLIVVGGNGSYETTARMVYALPLVDHSFNKNRDEIMEDVYHGTIAACDAEPIHRYTTTKRGDKLIGAACTKEADTIESLPYITTPAACVGAGNLLPSAVSDIVVAGDSVFVSVLEAGEGQLPGIFYSQALLNGQGKIASWSPWKRFGGIQESVERMVLNTEQGFFAYTKPNQPIMFCHMTNDMPKNKTKPDEITASDDITDIIDQLLPPDVGGVQGLFDFNYEVPGVGDEHRISFLAVTGYKKLILIESGRDDEQGLFCGYHHGFMQDVVQCAQGTVPVSYNALPLDTGKPRVLEFVGGQIEQLGAITCAALVTDGQQSWLVVGGSHGIAVLSDDHGKGWDSKAGLLPHFAGLKNGMQFRKIGSYRYIKKLVGDNGNLYIVSSTTWERITLSAETIKNNNHRATLLASSKEVGTFFDVAVSGPLALLATANGLWFNGSHTDCSIDDAQSLSWKKVPFAQHISRVSKLFFVEHSLKYGFGKGAQLYVFAQTGTDHATSLYRLYIDDVFAHGVKDTSVQLLSDHIFAQKPVPFLSFNSPRNFFMTNGAHYMVGSSAGVTGKPFAHLITLPAIKKPVQSEPLTFAVPLNISKASKSISAVVQNSATGNWLIAGDFGLRIHN